MVGVIGFDLDAPFFGDSLNRIIQYTSSMIDCVLSGFSVLVFPFHQDSLMRPSKKKLKHILIQIKFKFFYYKTSLVNHINIKYHF